MGTEAVERIVRDIKSDVESTVIALAVNAATWQYPDALSIQRSAVDSLIAEQDRVDDGGTSSSGNHYKEWSEGMKLTMFRGKGALFDPFRHRP